MSDSPRLTTADVIVRFRKELADGNVPPDVVDDLTRDAFRALMSEDGLGVRDV